MMMIFICSMGLLVLPFFVIPKNTNSSEKEKLKQFVQFLCNNIFNSVQNICEIFYFQKDDLLSPLPDQNVHKGESTVLGRKILLLNIVLKRNVHLYICVYCWVHLCSFTKWIIVNAMMADQYMRIICFMSKLYHGRYWV